MNDCRVANKESLTGKKQWKIVLKEKLWRKDREVTKSCFIHKEGSIKKVDSNINTTVSLGNVWHHYSKFVFECNLVYDDVRKISGQITEIIIISF